MYPSISVIVAVMHSFIFSVLILVNAAAGADFSRAEAAFDALQSFYNPTQGLWDTSGWWNGANCMTSIADLAKIDHSIYGRAVSVFSNTYQNAPAYNPAPQVNKVMINGMPSTTYGSNSRPSQQLPANSTNGNAVVWADSCYDDDGWWALAWMYAYDLTGNTHYLKTAAGIFDIMGQGGPTSCGNGGIHWCSNSNYVNAIANELYLSVAAHLANRIPYNSTYYKTKAVSQWNWFKSQAFFNKEGTINDGLTDDCQNNGQTVWSYNQGVILGGLVELYKANGDDSLLTTANQIARAAITNLTDPQHVLHDVCEPNCAPDATQFKGIFIRNLAILNKQTPDFLYTQVIQASAESIWANDRGADNNIFSVDWSGPYVNPANSSTHSSAFEAIIAQAGL